MFVLCIYRFLFKIHSFKIQYFFLFVFNLEFLLIELKFYLIFNFVWFYISPLKTIT